MSDNEDIEESGPLPPQAGPENNLRKEALAALRAIPDHTVDDAQLNVLAAAIARSLAYAKISGDASIGIFSRFPSKVESLRKAFADHAMPLTQNLAVKALSASHNLNPENVAQKFSHFVSAYKNQFGITVDYESFLDKKFGALPYIMQVSLNLPLSNLVGQHKLLAQDGIEIDLQAYIEKALEYLALMGLRPQTVLERAQLILEACALNRLPFVSNKDSKEHILFASFDCFTRTGAQLIAGLLHIRLAPVLAPKAKGALLSYATLTANAYRPILGGDLVGMLGADKKHAIFNPAREKQIRLASLEENRQRKNRLLTMLIELELIPGYRIDPEIVPQEVKDMKYGQRGTDSPARQRQKYYVRRYFGEDAGELSGFELYRKIITSDLWKAVVEPAAAALARRQQLAADAAQRDFSERAVTNLTRWGVAKIPETMIGEPGKPARKVRKKPLQTPRR